MKKLNIQQPVNPWSSMLVTSVLVAALLPNNFCIGGDIIAE